MMHPGSPGYPNASTLVVNDPKALTLVETDSR